MTIRISPVLTREQAIDAAVRRKPLFVSDIGYWDRCGSARGHMANCASCAAIIHDVRAEFARIMATAS